MSSSHEPQAEDDASIHEFEAESSNPLKLDQVKNLKERAKAKTKKILLQHDSTSEDDSKDIFSDAAFNPTKVLDDTSPVKPRKSSTSPTDHLKTIAFIATHPRRAIRQKATRKAAGKIGSARRPVNTARDQEYLAAQDALAKATSSASSVRAFDSDYEEPSDLDKARKRVRSLEEQRESLQSAWVTSRHVSRVKAVAYPRKPRREDFRRPTSGRFDWERYLGMLAVYYTRGFTAQYVDDFSKPPFDLQDLARIVERLAITSAPWQAFLLDVRRIYRWDDPWRTARWGLLYWTLWYFQYMAAYLYAWIILSTLRNRFRASSIENMRETVLRGVDREAKAQAWGELIQRHGKNDWLDPLLDDIGPLIQIQLGDLANFLEVLLNFHRHERPSKTAGTLFFFTMCLLIALVVDMASCVKIWWLVIGCWFFFGFPIATRYPKYRLLCSWPRWIFWDIPTHSELAIIRLQEKAVLRNAEVMDSEVAEDYDSSDYMTPETFRSKSTRGHQHTFKVHHKKHLQGRLVVNRGGIEYHGKRTESYRYLDLSEMRKIDVNSKMERMAAFQSYSRGLEFIWRTDSSLDNLVLIVRVSDLDKIFNLILGWSGLKWQTLQIERHKNIEEQRSHLDKTLKRALK